MIVEDDRLKKFEAWIQFDEGYQRNPEADTRSARQKRMDDPDKGINSPAFRKFMADREKASSAKKVKKSAPTKSKPNPQGTLHLSPEERKKREAKRREDLYKRSADMRRDHKKRGVSEGKGYQPEIEHSKMGDAKKKADKKKESKLPPHLQGDAIGKMRKAFASTNEHHQKDKDGNTIPHENLNELNRYGKETGKATGSMNKRPGSPVKKGGSGDKALNVVRGMIRKQQGKPEGQQKKVKGVKSDAGTGKYLDKQKSKKEYAAKAKKAGYKNPQDYTNVVARYGSEDNMKKGRGLGT